MYMYMYNGDDTEKNVFVYGNMLLFTSNTVNQ